MTLPDGIELNTQKLRYDLYIGAFPVEPSRTKYLLVDVCRKNLGDSQLFDDGVEAFCRRVTAMRSAFNDEEMYVFCAPEFVEKLYLATNPFRLRRVGRANDDDLREPARELHR